MILHTVELPDNCRCPGCFRKATLGVKDPQHGTIAACGVCMTVWEPLPADAPPDIGIKPQPFRKSCDNCAFHQNSPERQDKEKWDDLQMSMAYQERPFYCHKGVPIQIEGDGYPLDHGFRYPLGPDGQPDQSRLRLCAGFIAWWHKLTTEPVPGL